MVTLIKQRRPHARRAQRCTTCLTPIHPGTQYVRSTYAYDGRVYDIVTCTRCEEILGEVSCWSGNGDEGVGYEDYYAWASETAQHDRQADPAWSHAVDFLARHHYATHEGADRA